MAVRRFDVAVLVRLADVDTLRLDLVVIHQVAVTRAKLAVVREVVDRRAEAVGAVLARHAPQSPKRFLQPSAERLERLGETDRHRLPIRIRQREVIEHVVKRLPGDRHTQRVHAREIRRPQPARVMDLREHHLPARAMLRSPVANPTLERTPLRFGEPPGIAVLQPAEERHGTQPRLGLQPSLHLRPDFGERVHPRPPRPRQSAGRRQPFRVPIFPCRLLVHASFPCRQGQAITTR